MTDFLAHFPSSLRPLMQPVFFFLGRVPVGVPSAALSTFAEGVASAIRGDGLSWHSLFFAVLAGGTDGDLGDLQQADSRLCIELVGSLCFWCSHPGLSPAAVKTESEAGSEETVEKKNTTSCTFDVGPMITILQQAALAASSSHGGSCGDGGGGVVAIARRLDDIVGSFPRAIGLRLANALLKAPSFHDMCAIDSRVLDAGTAFILRGLTPLLWESPNWVPIFRDSIDGRSFNSLLKGALHYEGPALLVVMSASGDVFGALSFSWVDGFGKFGGTSECFLFALSPSLHVFRTDCRSGNFSYLNAKNKHAPRGIGFGGQEGFCRLWLDADFEDCYVLQSDATYQDGPLLPSESYRTEFQMAHVEVWGCGGEEALAAQATQRERDQNVRDRARKVDRAKLLENDFDKEMFFGNTFKASEGAREETGVVENRGDR
eukprot:TRINITY_DN51363_c0_g1_i1.p1 TRINITY_DN51363_c0_g1~~TRINITY_DN51363_c0_g1_i1.p1  ORF type:complete len:499 (-),score=68.62 TRINITY_DN51363_c0_g1_i1:22-1317(-)